MKKASIALIVLTLVFSAFIGGFFLGRNFNHSQVNISAVIAVTIPGETAAEAEPTDIFETTAATEPILFPLNINTATAEELTALPGIGPALAQRIVDYRENNGPYNNVAELSNVSGIGEKRLEAILDYITVGG